MKISYAPHADVLYIVFEETTNKCAYVETESGAVCRVDETTDRVVGITVPYFKRLTEHGDNIIIPELRGGLSADKLLQNLHGEG